MSDGKNIGNAVPRIISSSGRGGSTWVQDALASANGLPTIFEPFKSGRVPGAEPYAYLHLEPEDERRDLRVFLDEILSGRRARTWCQYRINTHHILHGFKGMKTPGDFKCQMLRYMNIVKKGFRYRNPPSGPPVVKFIRSCLMVSWLKQVYGAHVMVLLRHPAAVVESKARKITWNSENALSCLFASESVRAKVLEPAGLTDYRGLSREACFALHWCIETKMTLLQARQADIPVIYYERLVAEPESEWKRAARALDLAEVPDESVTRRPSQQASMSGRNETYNLDFLKRWEKRLDSAVLAEIQGMLDRFELDVYSLDSPFPV